MSVVYWDSNVFIKYLEADGDSAHIIIPLIECAARKEITICTSTLTIAEVAFVSSERNSNTLYHEVGRRIEGLWSPSGSPIELLEMSEMVARDARDLIRSRITHQLPLTPRDAIHIATAKRRRVNVLHTGDHDMWKWSTIAGFPIQDAAIFQPSLPYVEIEKH